MNEWNKLSMADRAAYIKLGIDNGITDLATIRDTYNKYAEGGSTKWTMQDETNYQSWKDKLPNNLKYTDESEYDLRGAYKAGMEPQWDNKDKSYHLGSRDPYSGRILKSPHHPTYLEALVTDASMGYYPSIDNKGNTYTNTWRGNKFAEGGYVREQNNNPIAFDEEGNLIDQVTGEKGTMILPEVTVRGISPETRARNYSSAYHPEDALEFFDIMTRPITAPITPSLQVGAIRNALNGGSYYKSLMGIEPNLGITTENFNKERPYLSMGANLTFDMLSPFGLKGVNRGINAASTFVGKKYVTPHIASKILNRTISANPKGQILVSDSYFNSPNNWYRISNTPEVYGIKEIGKNVTTRDSGALIDVPSDNWRTSVLEQPLIRDKEGYLALDPQKDFVEFSNWDNFSADKVNFSPRLFQKSGSAHGNRTQAAKGQIWKGGLSNSSMFPTIVIEGEAAQQVPMGLTRTNFKLSPWEDIPMGHRIGFKTGEMPMENLSYFQDLKNGKYSYQGQIIPDKRIEIIPTSTTETTSSNTFTGFNDMRAYSEFVNRLDRDYTKAYLEGDIETGQRMWDNWFKFRTPNNKAIDAQGNPIKTYHTVSDQYNPSFNIFDTNIERIPTAIYTTDNPIMSASYAHTPVDEATLNVKLDKSRKYYDYKIKQAEDNLKQSGSKDIDLEKTFDPFSDEAQYLSDLTSLQRLQQEKTETLNRIKNSYSPQRRKELYLNLENPLEIEGYGKSWQDIPIVVGEGLENFSLSKNIPKAREFANKYGIYFDDPNDILYLNKDALLDEYLEQIGKQSGIKYPNMDNIDEYPIEIQKKVQNFFELLNKKIPSIGKKSTRSIENIIRWQKGTNFDSAIIKDIGDWGGNAETKLMFDADGNINTGTVFESFKPSQLKYSQPFTLDDNGKLIPLSKRADFTNPDMRYSLLPIGLTIGGATYLNQRNKNK